MTLPVAMRPLRWTGIDEHGREATGCGRVEDTVAFVRQRYDDGWHSLRVAAGPGPVPPAEDEPLVGAIDSPDGRRSWWAAL